MKFTASAFMLLICTAALLSTTEGKSEPRHLRCSCLKTYSEPAIPAGKILSLRVIPAGPHCKNEAIIATVKLGQVCLNPNKDWVISLKKESYKRKTTINPDALLSTTEAGRTEPLNLHCECSETYSEPIPAEKILSLKVIPAGPHCKNVEIIVTMKEGKKCLDPTKEWEIPLNEESNKRKTTINPDALLSTTEAGRTEPLNLHCECSETYSEPIPAEKMLSLRVIPAGPHCKNEEIIAAMQKGQICLDPTKDWVISLKEELIRATYKFLPVSPDWIEKEVVVSTSSFTSETTETFCVMQNSTVEK